MATGGLRVDMKTSFTLKVSANSYINNDSIFIALCAKHWNQIPSLSSLRVN